MRTDRSLRTGIVAIFTFAAAGMTGCSTMNNTEKGAGIGAAVGTGIGLAAGAATGNPRTGAAVGALVGGGTGALIGNDVDRQERRDRDVQQAVASANAQAQQLRMGVFDVVDLARKGHDDQVIVNQIRATGSTFQLTNSDLDALKANGVSPRVIAEMQAARGPSTLGTRVVTQPATTVIYESPPPYFVRPYYAPQPYIFVGGHFGHRHRHCD